MHGIERRGAQRLPRHIAAMLALAASLVAAGPAAAVPQWLAPLTLSGETQNNCFTQPPPLGSPPGTPSTTVCVPTATPEVQLDDQGNALAVWEVPVPPDSYRVVAATRPAGQSFSAPAPVSGLIPAAPPTFLGPPPAPDARFA